MTLERHQYPDPIHAGFVWYDTRGSGTESVTAYDYYYSQQLYAYDLVVLVHDSTLTRVSLMSPKKIKPLTTVLTKLAGSLIFGSCRSVI